MFNEDNFFEWFGILFLLFVTTACLSQLTSNYYITKYAIENGYEQTEDGRWVKGDNNEN